MDIAEKMAADIALAIDGGDWQDAKWFSKFHREAWIKAVQPYADEIEQLREALREIYEVYAGSEGIPQPMTAAEGYLLSLFMEAVRIAQEARRRKSDGYC